MKISATLIGIVLLGTSLAACSGDSDDKSGGASEAYCTDIAAAKPIFKDLSSGDLSKLEEGFTTFHRLADEAPGDLKDDWKVLDDAATSVEKSLKDKGLTYDDLVSVQKGTMPPGVDINKLTSLAAELQQLNDTSFTDARTAIAEQAKASCDVDLGGV